MGDFAAGVSGDVARVCLRPPEAAGGLGTPQCDLLKQVASRIPAVSPSNGPRWERVCLGLRSTQWVGLKGQEAVLQHLEWHVAGEELPLPQAGTWCARLWADSRL